MHYSTRRRVAFGLTTGGLLMTGLGMTSAQADTGASASGGAADSPGVGSGNVIQAPIDLPVNVCGNQVGVVAILDTVGGNSCANSGDSGSSASGSSHGSPGIGSGNLIQIPVDAPVNVCGNQLDVIGIGNSDRGNSCKNGGKGKHRRSGTSASGSGSDSPGVGAGNVLQVPVKAPVNVCGNQGDVIGILNSVTRNSCGTGGSDDRPLPHPAQPQGPGPLPPWTPPFPVPLPGSTSISPAPSPKSAPPVSPCSAPDGGTTAGTPNSGDPTDAEPPVALREGPGSPDGPSGSGGSGRSGGLLAHTGTDALSFAPLGAGLFGSGVALRRRAPRR
jgi:hypothetical protein